MTSRLAWLAICAALYGCAVGPGYRPAPVVPASAAVGAGSRSDSTRAFFDSLVAARAADSLGAPAPALAPRVFAPDSLVELRWLDILGDSTLIQVIQTALRQNRDLVLAQARIREFRATRGIARAPLFPSVALNGSLGKNQIAIGAFPPVRYTAWRLTGDIGWEPDIWGGTRRGLQAAGADLEATEATERAVALALVSDVASAYLQLLELDQERAIDERTLATRQATLDLARQRYARGVIAELDVRQFEAAVAVPAAQLAQVEQQRAQVEHALNVLLGEAPSPVPRGAGLAEAARALVVPDSVPATLLDRRPDVRAAEREYAAAMARIGVAWAGRLPTLTITASSGSQSPAAGRLFTPATDIYQLQAGISIPLFTGGRLVNTVRLARAQAEQARAQYEQTTLFALQEAGDALAGVRAARDVVAAQETQTRALRRALELADLRYRTGVSSYLEVLDAQRTLFDAEQALSRARLQQLIAAVQLYKALGGSWEVPAH